MLNCSKKFGDTLKTSGIVSFGRGSLALRKCAGGRRRSTTTPGAKAKGRREASRAGFAMYGIFDSGEATLVCSQLRTGVCASSIVGLGFSRFTDQSLRWTVDQFGFLLQGYPARVRAGRANHVVLPRRSGRPSATLDV